MTHLYSHARVSASARASRQRGLSLVEMMIALALSGIVTAGVVQLFVANSTTYNMLQGQSRMQESGRFALEFIGRGIREAGYRGCFSSNDDIHTTMNPPGAIPYEFDLRAGVTGYDYIDVINKWGPTLAMELPQTDSDGDDTNVFQTTAGVGAGNGIDPAAIMEGTDIITLRALSTTEARLAVDMPTSQEPVVIRDPAATLQFDVDHLVMIHDCQKATIFRVTQIQRDTPAGGESTIGHDLDDVDATRNDFLRLALLNTFDTDAAVSSVITNIFFIAPGTGVNNAGNTPLSLWRKSGVAAPVELVEGVEDLQVLYGIDTTEDRVPNRYVPANQVLDWREVATVRITVVVNSVDDVGATSVPTHGCSDLQPCPDGEAADGLLRRSFTQTVQLRNHG